MKNNLRIVVLLISLALLISVIASCSEDNLTDENESETEAAVVDTSDSSVGTIADNDNTDNGNSDSEEGTEEKDNTNETESDRYGDGYSAWYPPEQ